MFPAARCDVCSGSEWLVVALHGQLLSCKGAFSTLLLEFHPGALRFPPHGEQQCGVCSGEQWGGGGRALSPAGYLLPKMQGVLGLLGSISACSASGPGPH